MCRGVTECVCSLLAQVSGHIAAFEALEEIQVLGQPLGGLTVGSAAIGQSVRAAALQALQTAEITVFRVGQHVCEVGIARGEEDTRTNAQAGAQVNEWNTSIVVRSLTQNETEETQLHKHMFAFTQTKVK